MRRLLTILLSFIFLQSFSQDTIQVTIKTQPGVTGYDLQYSKDLINWTSSDEIFLPTKDGVYKQATKIYPGYWRIHVLGLDQYTDIKQVYSPLPVGITNTAVKNGVITWTSHNEDLKYYSIEESEDGINFVETGRVMPKGDSDYKFILK